MKIINTSPQLLIPYANNPRKNESAVDPIAKSIQEFGFIQPIVVDENYVIIIGHTRWQAALKLKLTEVPILIATGFSAAKVKALRLADNRLGEIAVWDEKLLQIELETLSNFDYDLSVLGFDENELQQYLGELEIPVNNDEPPLNYEAKFQVVVECEDEADQQAIYKMLTAKGCKCKVLSM